MSQLPPPPPDCWIALDSRLGEISIGASTTMIGRRLHHACTRAHLYPVGRANIHHHNYSPALAELHRHSEGRWQELRAELLTGLHNRATVPSHAATTHREKTGDPVTPPPTT